MRYITALVPGATGVASALVTVEYVDTSDTIGKTRAHGLRDVTEILEFDPGLSRTALIEQAAAHIELSATLVYSTGGSTALADAVREARRAGLIKALRVRAVTIVAGEQLAMDSLGYRMGDSEIIKALQEAVKVKSFTLPAGAEFILRAAMSMQVQVAPQGTLRFPQRKDEASVFALALALYPRLAPPHQGRRYLTEATPRRPSKLFDSYDAADGAGAG